MSQKLREGFLWGNSVSSMQTEGGWNEDGKGLSVYDIREAGEFASDWHFANDNYHHYDEDFDLMKEYFEKVYETSIQTSIQNIIKEEKENNELLSAVGQMSLCFTEVIVFVVLAFVAKFIEERVFYMIFVLSIISTLTINFNIKQERNHIK